MIQLIVQRSERNCCNNATRHICFPVFGASDNRIEKRAWQHDARRVCWGSIMLNASLGALQQTACGVDFSVALSGWSN